MDSVNLLRAVYILAAAGIVATDSVPALRERLVAYGPRTASSQASTQLRAKSDETSAEHDNQTVWPLRILDAISSLQVPHSWFSHFYVVSVLSSLFWAVQLYTRGRVFQVVSSMDANNVSNSMSLDQVTLLWVLMAVQGARRLYESLAFTSRSSSQMWVAHWALGVGFYIVTGMSIWVEGIPVLRVSEISLRSLILKPPSLRTFVGLPVFILASGIQYDCHGYLASLQKYSLPMHPMFQLLICPHYSAECLIYFSLVVVGAPPGNVLNKTVLSALVFVAVNLGITARTTRKWYSERFGHDKVKDRWVMVPFVY